MILVFGKNGQVATGLRQILPEAKFVGSDSANFLDVTSVVKALDENRPSIVINAAAYTQVDKAETEQTDALTINSKTPGAIAEWCKNNDALMIHYSTDYVFDGTGERPWIETDATSPVNFYGFSKLAGEKAIQATGCRSYIFRVSWVYSPWGNNFKKTILRLAQEREELKIVADQWGSPTRAEDIAAKTVEFVREAEAGRPREYGIYHWRFDAYTTWHQFAESIVNEARAQGLPLKVQRVVPIASSDFPTPAKRPMNSRLGTVRK